MHDAPVAAGHGYRSDAHVNRQGPTMPRARPPRPTEQHAPPQHAQHPQPLVNGSMTVQEPQTMAGTAGSEASAGKQESARAPAAQPRKKADDSGTGVHETMSC